MYTRMSKPVIILGAGGHSKVLLDIVSLRKLQVIGIVDKDDQSIRKLPYTYCWLGNDDAVYTFPPESVQLINAVGSVDLSPVRGNLFERFKARGYSFATLIHPSAVIAKDAILGEGIQVMAGAIIQPGSQIGDNVIVNSAAVIEHDCKIASHVHIAPRSVLSGSVEVGARAHVGTGAVVIQGITIGENSLVAAGAVVIRNVSNNSRVAGVPAVDLL